MLRVRSLSDSHHEIAVEFTGGDMASQRALQELLEERTGLLGIEPTEEEQQAFLVEARKVYLRACQESTALRCGVDGVIV